jgi:hypothetical protein
MNYPSRYRLYRWQTAEVVCPWVDCPGHDPTHAARQTLAASADAYKAEVETPEGAHFFLDVAPPLKYPVPLYSESARRADKRLRSVEKIDTVPHFLPAEVVAAIPAGAIPLRYLRNQILQVQICADSLLRCGGLVDDDAFCRWVLWSAEPLLEACGFPVGTPITKRRTMRQKKG